MENDISDQNLINTKKSQKLKFSIKLLYTPFIEYLYKKNEDQISRKSKTI